jgi:hypothetical protein
MKKRHFLTLIFALAVITAKPYMVKTISTDGGLSVIELLGEDWNQVDSVVISGKLSDADIAALANCARNGQLKGIDMSHCILPNDSLPSEAFLLAKKLQNIVLPLTLHAIGNSAFSYSGLIRCMVPEGVCVIEGGTFEYCHGLTEVVLPKTLKRIGSGAFRFTAIHHIDLPTSLEYIGACAFEATSIENVVIPESVMEIGWGTFRCRKLKSIQLPNGIRELKKETFAESSLEQLNWPTSLEIIGEHAFGGTFLAQAILPAGVREIGENAFSDCTHLSLVILPRSLESINESAFDSTPLQHLYCQSSVPPMVTRRTEYQENNARWVFHMATLYVPVGSADAYRSAYFWMDFENIVECNIEVDAITDVNVFSSISAQTPDLYDLHGVRIRALPPKTGVYIENGRKVVIR